MTFIQIFLYISLVVAVFALFFSLGYYASDFFSKLVARFSKKEAKYPKALERLEAGDEIIIEEWPRMVDPNGLAQVIKNDLMNKKILLEVEWGNYKERNINKTERRIFHYTSSAFKNFDLLNDDFICDISEQHSERMELENQLKNAIEEEKFELAAELRDKINKQNG